MWNLHIMLWKIHMEQSQQRSTFYFLFSPFYEFRKSKKNFYPTIDCHHIPIYYQLLWKFYTIKFNNELVERVDGLCVCMNIRECYHTTTDTQSSNLKEQSNLFYSPLLFCFVQVKRKSGKRNTKARRKENDFNDST